MSAPTSPLVISDVDYTALAVLVVLFVVVAVLGFMAARLRRGDSLESLDEWGLGGRKFGSWITWFLLGGDIYTAYTFVAVPAAMFALGAVSGFFAVPYTDRPVPDHLHLHGPAVVGRHVDGYVTPADFVRGRYGSKMLALAIALTGIVATMPYIALQLVGMQAVLEVMGLGGTGSWLAKDLPLLIAFAVLAAYTYSSGLRAPALIAFVKDGLIYLVIAVAIIYLPHQVRWLAAGSSTPPRRRCPRPARPPASRPVRSSPVTGNYAAYCDARARVGDGAVHVPPLDDGLAVHQGPQRHPAERDLPAGVLARCSGCSRCSATSPSPPAPSRSALDGERQPAAGGPAAVRGHLPELVRRHRLRRHRHRGPGAGGDHVDRGRQPVHPQHLQGLHQPRGQPRAEEARVSKVVLAGGEGRRAGVRAVPRSAERDQLPAARRHLDPADVPDRSCSASSPAGSTSGPCWSAGRWRWSTARCRPTTW